jgi:hypothetical protein
MTASDTISADRDDGEAPASDPRFDASLDDLTGPGLHFWNEVEETDTRYVKSFDRGSFKGTAVDAIYNVKRISEKIGAVGYAWGWTIASERLDSFGVGEDQQVIHTCVLRAWFRQPDGSKEHVEHVGHTKAAYWTRARRPGEKPRYIVDEEFGKKSVTDALSKIMVSLGASADIWLGRFDGNKYVAPLSEGDANGVAAPDDSKLLAHARDILAEVRKADGREDVLEAARRLKGTFGQQPFWPLLVAADRDLAAEIQALVRGKAKALELDLSKV